MKTQNYLSQDIYISPETEVIILTTESTILSGNAEGGDEGGEHGGWTPTNP